LEKIRKIMSGGQTGVDQAALKAALDLGFEIGGWCPPGRICESGLIPAEFPLKETETERSQNAPDVPRSLRTELNVRDANATLILQPCSLEPDPGTKWTIQCATNYRKPFLLVDPSSENALERILAWLHKNKINTLNVAGPSESQSPEIFGKSYELLIKVFTLIRQTG
jgi:hypothetical protein